MASGARSFYWICLNLFLVSSLIGCNSGTLWIRFLRRRGEISARGVLRVRGGYQQGQGSGRSQGAAGEAVRHVEVSCEQSQVDFGSRKRLRERLLFHPSQAKLTRGITRASVEIS